VKRLAVVAVLVLAVALLYRTFASPETGTGNLTLAAPAPNVGSMAENFTARDVEGNTFELSDNGVYVLAFWSPLNQNSNRARPAFLEVAREYGDEASFAVVYVNGAREDVDAPYDRLYDPTGRLASLYNVKRVPRLFVVRDGVIWWVLGEDQHYGGYEEDLKQRIDEALAQKNQEDPQTALAND
jgi:thiol-disulfide isomerase/thioredoxin